MSVQTTAVCLMSLSVCYVNFYACLYYWDMDLNAIALPSILMSAAMFSLHHFGVAYAYMYFDTKEAQEEAV